MKALIIAAGAGRRLRPFYSPKPLTPLFGLLLIERILLASKLAGIQNFKIVVGYKANKIKKAIGDGTKYGVQIEYINNPDWEKGNGVSIYKARHHFHGKFLLLMSDHLFDETILNRLLKVHVKKDQCVLCVDKNLSGDHFALDDAVRVQCEEGNIQNIGKSLTSYNAIDTGIFLCTPILFDALKKSIKKGHYSLSAGNQILAKQGKLSILDITDYFWVDVDDESALKKAKKELIQHLFKATDGPISKRVNRPFSTKLSAFFAQYHISPNSLTMASFGLAILSAVLFYVSGYWNVLIAGILAQLSSILDGCDGEIARLKFKFSTFGEWLDKILDRYADGLMILGITHGIWQSSANDFVWLIGFITMTGTFMNSYTAAIYDSLLRKNAIQNNSFRIGRDIRLFIIFIGAVLHQLFLTLVILAVITNVESIRRLFVVKDVYAVKSVN